MTGSKRMRIVDKEDYAVDLEYTDSLAILHLPRVDRFTKTVYQDMFIVVEDLWEFIQTIGYQGMYIAITPSEVLLNKFVKKLGFHFLGIGEGLAVYQYKGS